MWIEFNKLGLPAEGTPKRAWRARTFCFGVSIFLIPVLIIGWTIWMLK